MVNAVEKEFALLFNRVDYIVRNWIADRFRKPLIKPARAIYERLRIGKGREGAGIHISSLGSTFPA